MGKVQRRTITFHNRETEARRSLKVIKKEMPREDLEVRKNPKWKTWDVVKVIKVKKVRREDVPFWS